MIMGVHAEALGAAAYAVVLVLAAAGLEGIARYAGWRADRYHAAGFRYHPALDVWVCPEGEHLRPSSVGDGGAAVVRYRARAHICNVCPAKPQCTDSDEGRAIEHDLRPWLETGVGQFQRGMSLTLLVLAGMITLIELARHPRGADGIALAIVAVAVATLGGRCFAAFAKGIGGRRGGLEESRSGPTGRNNTFGLRTR
jgi:hypothetical protein